MTANTTNRPDPLKGAIAGIAGGLAASFVMTQFQALVAKVAGGVPGDGGKPATEKAADKVSSLVLGHPVPKQQAQLAGEAVHYAFGAAVGGAYGVAAEYRQGVTLGQGAAFGLFSAAALDEGATFASGLAKPPWTYPPAVHLYSFASHLVYGVTTELSRRLVRPLLDKARCVPALLGRTVERLRGVAARPRPLSRAPSSTQRDALQLAVAFGLGAASGARTGTPPALVSGAAALGFLDLSKGPLAFLGSWRSVAVLAPMMLSELVLDKLPGTPDRTMAPAIAARVVSGAVCGAAVASSGGGEEDDDGRRGLLPWAGALAGAAGALLGTFGGHAARTGLAEEVDTDWPVAVAEDALAIGGSLLLIHLAWRNSAPRD
jgi:uncharacterized membrane protein